MVLISIMRKRKGLERRTEYILPVAMEMKNESRRWQTKLGHRSARVLVLGGTSEERASN